jgi:hypothetical protein
MKLHAHFEKAQGDEKGLHQDKKENKRIVQTPSNKFNLQGTFFP